MRGDLRKLSIGDAFDEAFDLYKRNFRLFATTAALLYVPANAVVGAVVLMMQTDQFGAAQPSPQDVERMFGMLGILFLGMVVYFFLIAALSGAVSVAASERYLDRPVTLGLAYRAMAGALPRLLAAWFIVGLLLTVAATIVSFILIVLFSVIVAAAGSTGVMDQAVATAFGIAVVVVIAVVNAVLFVWMGIFITPIVMLERAGPFAALQRNIELARGRALSLSLGFIGLAVAVFSVDTALSESVHGGFTLLLYPWFGISELVKEIIHVCISGIVSLIIHPLWMTTFTILYYDQRVRNEGFDLALMLVNLDARHATAAATLPEGAV